MEFSVKNYMFGNTFSTGGNRIRKCMRLAKMHRVQLERWLFYFSFLSFGRFGFFRRVAVVFFHDICL